MHVSLGRLAFGGFVATAVFTISMYAVAPSIAGAPTDIAGAVARILDVPWEFGMLIHFVNGTVVFPALYGLLVYPLLPGPPSVRGLVWGLLLWVVAALVVVPANDDLATAVSLAAHAVYGVILGRLTGPATVPLTGGSRPAAPPPAERTNPTGTASPHRR